MTAVDDQAAQSVADQLGMRLGTVYSAKSRVLARIKQVVQLGDLQDSIAKPFDQNQVPSLREGTK
jgi:DNA-directed RNA polymerase specialized sigma24 family protein